MGTLPDWFMNYGNAPGSIPVQSQNMQMPPGSSPPRLPDWLMNYGNGVPASNASFGPPKTSALPGGGYNDMDNVPYDPTQGVNNSSQDMRGAPMPPPGPAPAPARAPLNILPPPRPGGNWDTTAALEGDPAGQPAWATPQAQGAAAAEDRQIGPGSWFDPSKMGRMVDPNSLIGKMMAMRNPGAAPKAQQPDQGLLSGLFADGGMFGRDPTTPNNTIGGLW